MKGKKRIKLLKSQKLLLDMKGNEIGNAIAMVRAKQDDLQTTLNMIMLEEHHVPREELAEWKITEDGQAIEWVKPEDPEKNKKEEK
jgi:hypothetical protein